MLTLLQATNLPQADPIAGLPPGWRVVAIIVVALLLHLAVRLLQRAGEWIVTPSTTPGNVHQRFAPTGSVSGSRR